VGRCLFVLLVVFCYSNLTLANKDDWNDNKKEWTPLMCAIYKGKHKKVKKILVKDVNPNYTTNKGVTALEIAIRRQDTLSMKMLFDSEKLNVDGDSLYYFDLACSNKSTQVIDILVKRIYRLNYLNPPSNSLPLFTATSFGSIEVLHKLLELGFDINSQSELDGMTPLMLAVNNANVPKIKLLIKYSADKTIISKNGKKAVDYIPQGFENEIKTILK